MGSIRKGYRRKGTIAMLCATASLLSGAVTALFVPAADATNSPSITAVGPSTDAVSTTITTGQISAVLSGGSTSPGDTGTITFTVFGPLASAPTSCGSGGTTVGTATASGNGTYNPTSSSFAPSQAGHYWWYASIIADGNNNAAASACGGGMSETVVGATPAISAAGPSTDVVSTAVSASSISSVMTSGSTSPAVSGTITFAVFGPTSTEPSTCTSGYTTVGSATVTGNGTYASSGSFTPSSSGDYWWYAIYGGDANNNATTSACGSSMSETVVGNGAAPSATTTAATSVAGLSATLTGTINPNDPIGNLGTAYYFVYGTTGSYGSTTSSVSGGTGTTTSSVAISISGLLPHTVYYFQLIAYNIDGQTQGGQQSFTTTQAASVATTTAANSITTNSATLTGTVVPYDSTNTLNTTYYFEYGTDTTYAVGNTATTYVGYGNSAIAVSATITGLTPNTTYDFQLVSSNTNGASFGGNVAFTTAAPFSNTSISLSANPTTTTAGNSTTMYATVSPANAVGTVAFSANGTAIASCSAVTVNSGTAQCTANFSGVGTNTLLAVFSGSTNFGSSASPALTFTVSSAATKTTLKLRKAKVTYGKETQERLTATVVTTSGGLSPTGTVTIKQGTKKLCSFSLSLRTGSCALSARKLKAGTDRIVATYTGGGSFASSSSVRTKLIINKP